MPVELPLEIWLDILRLVSLRELSVLQSNCWLLRHAVGVELERRAKLGLQNEKSAVYLTVREPRREVIPFFLFTTPITRAYRFKCYEAGPGILRFRDPEELEDHYTESYGPPTYVRAGFYGTAGLYHIYGAKLPAQMQALYLSFPADIYYSGLLIYELEDPKPEVSGVSHYSCNPLRLRGFFCVETQYLEALIATEKADSYLGQKTEFPLQPLKLDFDFVLSYWGYRCWNCRILVPSLKEVHMTAKLKTAELMGEYSGQGETLREDRLRPRKSRTDFINILSEMHTRSRSCRCE
jgi:hypothetical protein